MNDNIRQIEFLAQQNAAMKELMAALRTCVPSWWPRAVLTLDAVWSPHTGARAMRHRLTNPETGEEVDQFPAELFEAATRLHVAFCTYEQGWKRAVLTLPGGADGQFTGAEAEWHYGP